MLAELMRLKSCVAIAGTHGKTTTTSMVAALLDAGGFDPTVINGGIINAYGTNARLGAGDWMVVEADESDGTFLKLPADIAVVTNVDPEHLDHFKTFDAVQDAFRAFVENVPFYGFSVMCTDHPGGAEPGRPHRGSSHRHLRREPAGRRAAASTSRTPAASLFTVTFRDRAGAAARDRKARDADAGPAQCAQRHRGGRRRPRTRHRRRPHPHALANFGGVRRRFTRTGDWNGVTVIDDYGHHPVEIAAVLRGRAGIDQGQGDRRGAAASL